MTKPSKRTIGTALLLILAFLGGAFVAFNILSDSGRNGPVVNARRQLLPSRSDADVSGVLEMIDQCLFVRHSPNTVHLVVWPHGAKWDSSTMEVRVDGVRLQPGDEFQAGGGFFSSETLTRFISGNEIEWLMGCTGQSTLTDVVVVDAVVDS